jgi:hypothetical protein
MEKLKAFIDRYNISLTIVGTALVLSTMFGQCSYDYTTGDLAIETNPTGAIEEWKGEPDTTDE